MPVAKPLKWDAEHPNLYTLEVSVVGADGVVLQKLSRKFGFVKIERVGRRVLVNGTRSEAAWPVGRQQCPGHGGQQHQSHAPEMGDGGIARRCDRLGVYVTDENPVDFAKNPVASDPQFLPQYLSFMADLVERDRDHPSVIMWGLDNESEYGSNVESDVQVTSAPKTRSALSQFSWASRVPVDQRIALRCL